MNKIETFPNRIASAQQSALYRSADNLAQNLYNRFPASRYLDYEISTRGHLGFSLKISPDKVSKTRNGAEAYIAAAVLLKGRREYGVAAVNGRYMRLRRESVPPYPPYLKSARIPRMPGHQDEIKREARELIIKNLEYAIKRFGFGPRGGSTGLQDLPYVRSRVGGR